ncbi:MAG: hypothetical protein E6Q97_34805 [Desulfurellales bacterium]|nr:MAG: hypothetical protein E6Q97_34805 [Desulfurellales bacterium]
MTLTEAFDELSEAGWLINNLHQNAAGIYCANFRKPVADGDLFTDWAFAPSLLDVLEMTINSLPSAEFFPEQQVEGSIDTSKPKSLLEAIGLAKPKAATPVRRI